MGVASEMSIVTWSVRPAWVVYRNTFDALSEVATVVNVVPPFRDSWSWNGAVLPLHAPDDGRGRPVDVGRRP